jgi:uncharacterized surface protein with fasciclin (FAS1) repeats
LTKTNPPFDTHRQQNTEDRMLNLKSALVVGLTLATVSNAKFFSKEDSFSAVVTSNPALSTFVKVAGDLGLIPTLASLKAVTILIPNNEAFKEIETFLPKLTESELRTILLRHVIEGALPSSVIASIGSRGVLETLASKNAVDAVGQNINRISFGVNPGAPMGSFFKAAALLSDGVKTPQASVLDLDVKFSTGYIHVIDKVLINSSELKALKVGK